MNTIIVFGYYIYNILYHNKNVMSFFYRCQWRPFTWSWATPVWSLPFSWWEWKLSAGPESHLPHSALPTYLSSCPPSAPRLWWLLHPGHTGLQNRGALFTSPHNAEDTQWLFLKELNAYQNFGAIFFLDKRFNVIEIFIIVCITWKSFLSLRKEMRNLWWRSWHLNPSWWKKNILVPPWRVATLIGGRFISLCQKSDIWWKRSQLCGISMEERTLAEGHSPHLQLAVEGTFLLSADFWFKIMLHIKTSCTYKSVFMFVCVGALLTALHHRHLSDRWEEALVLEEDGAGTLMS